MKGAIVAGCQRQCTRRGASNRALLLRSIGLLALLRADRPTLMMGTRGNSVTPPRAVF